MSKHEVACSNLRVGDTVRVERKDTERRTNGYNNTWTHDMDPEVGGVFKITEIDKSSGVRLDSKSACYFPAHVLRVTKAADTRDAVKVRVGGKYLARNGDIVELVRHDPSDDTYRSTAGCWYESDGKYVGEPLDYPDTLVRELKEETVASEALGGKVVIGTWYVTKSGKLAKANGGGFSDSTIINCTPFGYFRIENGAYNGHNGHDFDLVRPAKHWEYEGRVSGDNPNAPARLQLEVGKWYVTNDDRLALMEASIYNSHTLRADKLGNYDVNGGVYTGFPADYSQSIKRAATEAEYAGRKSGDKPNKPSDPAADGLQEDLREGMWYVTRGGTRVKVERRPGRDLSDTYPFVYTNNNSGITVTARGERYRGMTDLCDLVRLSDTQDPVTCDAAPAPSTGVDVVAGKWYVTRTSHRVKVVRRDDKSLSDDYPYVYERLNGTKYTVTKNGRRYKDAISNYDLVRLSSEQAPEPVAVKPGIDVVAGKWYMTRGGCRVKAERRSGIGLDLHFPYGYRRGTGQFYSVTARGFYYGPGDTQSADLVRLADVQDDGAPLEPPKATAEKLVLLAGSWYITRSGKLVQLDRRSGVSEKEYPFQWRYPDEMFDGGYKYACTAEGKYNYDSRSDHSLDIVRLATADEVLAAGQSQPRALRGVVVTHVVHDEFVTVSLVDQQGVDSTQPTCSTTLEEDDTMSSIIKIEKLTLVNGENIANMGDSSIISAIERAEADIKRLEALGTKPAFVVKQIEDLKAGITELAKVADERTAKKA